MRPKKILCGLLVIALASCNFSGKLTRRYKTITPEDVAADIAKNVGVDAYIIEKEKPEAAKPKTLFDLTDKGQKELIKQIGKNEQSNDKIIAALTSSLTAKTNAAVDIIDYTKVEKRVVVSIRNLSHMPADRISKITVRLKIDPDFKLLSCNKLTTEYQTLDLGKLNYSNSNQIELSGNASAGSTLTSGNTDYSENSDAYKNGDNSGGSKKTNTLTGGKSATVGQGAGARFNAARSFSEEVMLRQRMVTLNASISENTLSLYQESINGIDLTGNILADIVFSSAKDLRVERAYGFTDLFTGTTPNAPAALKVKETLLIFYNYLDDIKAELTFTADYRHVEKRDNTISEADDHIKLMYGEVTKPKQVTLLSQDQLRPKMWILYEKTDATHMPVQISSPSVAGSGELIFTSQAEAKEFLIWLKAKVADVVANGGKLGSLGHTILKPNKAAIDAAIINNLEIAAAN